MNRDPQDELDDIPDVEIADDVCKVCGGTGYALDFRSSRRQPCEDCWQDNGPDEPTDRESGVV